jgi:Rps23 Pro-64 3,4-dihydroxylase Tpa1-like proline 4-hydroxylase
MSEPIPLFQINPAIDRKKAASDFARTGRVQIRDFLTDAAARTIHRVLSRETPWGLAWRAGNEGPHGLRYQEVTKLGQAGAQHISQAIGRAMRGRDYAYLYGQYNLLDAHREAWGDHPALELLIEHINDEPLLNLVREVTGIPEIRKADGQGTLYAPQHFLAMHDDSHVAEGWKVAYVMNFCAEDWRPDWGGYLLFYDENDDVIAGFKPRFNALNMFKVPQRHNVTYVPPFAPVGRFAITGWFRDQ